MLSPSHACISKGPVRIPVLTKFVKPDVGGVGLILVQVIISN